MLQNPEQQRLTGVLKDLGYKACDAWLNENYEHIGVRNTMKLG